MVTFQVLYGLFTIALTSVAVALCYGHLAEAKQGRLAARAMLEKARDESVRIVDSNLAALRLLKQLQDSIADTNARLRKLTGQFHHMKRGQQPRYNDDEGSVDGAAQTDYVDPVADDELASMLALQSASSGANQPR